MVLRVPPGDGTDSAMSNPKQVLRRPPRTLTTPELCEVILVLRQRKIDAENARNAAGAHLRAAEHALLERQQRAGSRCGTEAGYFRHRRRGEPSCKLCVAAHTKACRRAERARKRRAATTSLAS
jgi:hypothetical protein